MSRHRARGGRRAAVVAVVAGALIVGGLVDRAAGGATLHASPLAPAAVPVAAPASALSSSWFCAGATDSPSGEAPGRVVVANDGPGPAAGRVTVVGTKGARHQLTITVAPYSSTSVAESLPGGSPWVGAVVDMEAGAVAVDQVVDGPLGRASTPCAVSGSTTWYFPTGQTRVNASDTITLLNPFPVDSVVDMSFITGNGLEQPQQFQGLDVPARGLVVADVGSVLARRSSITTVVSARNGSVVAWQTELVTPPAPGQPIVGTPAASQPLADPAWPVAGLTVGLGVPAAATSWVWPSGMAGDGSSEQYVVYNPGSRTALVRLSVGFDAGSAEPFDISVGAQQVVAIQTDQQARIPPGVPHTATLSSTNGVPVVAAHSLSDLEAPFGASRLSGVGVLGGPQSSAADWIVPAPATGARAQGHLVVFDTSGRPVPVRLYGLEGGAEKPLGSAPVSVPAHAAADLSLPAGTTEPVVARAGGPVYVEYDLYGTGGVPGTSLSWAVPLAPSS